MYGSGIPEGSSFAYEVGIRALDGQSKRIDAIDTKAAVILAVSGVFAGLLFGPGRDTALPLVLTTLIVAFLLLSGILALLSFWTRKYRTAPEFTAVVGLMVRDEEWLQWRFLGNIEEAERVNGRKLKWKVRLLTAAMVALLFNIILVGGYLVVILWGQVME